MARGHTSGASHAPPSSVACSAESRTAAGRDACSPSDPAPPRLFPTNQGIKRDGYGRIVIGDVIVGLNGKPVRKEADLFGGSIAGMAAVSCSSFQVACLSASWLSVARFSLCQVVELLGA